MPLPEGASTTMDANRAGCGHLDELLVGLPFEDGAVAGIGLSRLLDRPAVRATDPAAGLGVPRRNLGPFSSVLLRPSVVGIGPDWGPLTGGLRRHVGWSASARSTSVRVPLFSRGLAEPTWLPRRPRTAGWSGRPSRRTSWWPPPGAVGTDCRAADPTTVSTILPVTGGASAPLLPPIPPSGPARRRCESDGTLAPAVTVCVCWYTLPSQSATTPR